MLIPAVDMKRTGQKIVSLRTEKGMSVRDLQRLLGFTTPQSIYKWQRGETLPTIENLVVLSRICSVSMNEILSAECRMTDDCLHRKDCFRSTAGRPRIPLYRP
ncbi:MAG: helix-turn-helix transcriptional regulator [Clostridia bacterium]|nr:helix-turn-helix transcriptional regulator [Clostridia bacterium]